MSRPNVVRRMAASALRRLGLRGARPVEAQAALDPRVDALTSQLDELVERIASLEQALDAQRAATRAELRATTLRINEIDERLDRSTGDSPSV